MSELSLSEALASKRLEDFVAQAEKQGVGPAIRSDFDATQFRGHHTVPGTQHSSGDIA